MVGWLKDHHFSLERFSNKLHMETTMELSTGRGPSEELWSMSCLCAAVISSPRSSAPEFYFHHLDVRFKSSQGYKNKVSVCWQTAMYIARRAGLGWAPVFHDDLHHDVYHLDICILQSGLIPVSVSVVLAWLPPTCPLGTQFNIMINISLSVWFVISSHIAG